MTVALFGAPRKYVQALVLPHAASVRVPAFSHRPALSVDISQFSRHEKTPATHCPHNISSFDTRRPRTSPGCTALRPPEPPLVKSHFCLTSRSRHVFFSVLQRVAPRRRRGRSGESGSGSHRHQDSDFIDSERVSIRRVA
jgi:hypothetical protein